MKRAANGIDFLIIILAVAALLIAVLTLLDIAHRP